MSAIQGKYLTTMPAQTAYTLKQRRLEELLCAFSDCSQIPLEGAFRLERLLVQVIALGDIDPQLFVCFEEELHCVFLILHEWMQSVEQYLDGEYATLRSWIESDPDSCERVSLCAQLQALIVYLNQMQAPLERSLQHLDTLPHIAKTIKVVKKTTCSSKEALTLLCRRMLFNVTLLGKEHAPPSLLHLRRFIAGKRVELPFAFGRAEWRSAVAMRPQESTEWNDITSTVLKIVSVVVLMGILYVE